MKRQILFSMSGAIVAIMSCCADEGTIGKFNFETDLLCLHYDHAPDKDDGHSAAADRTLLETLHGREWIQKHVLAVSGAYGKNAGTFNMNSDAVMDAAWNDCGGWLAAHTNRDDVVVALAKRWSQTLKDGGDVWVKEGGQSDLTDMVLRSINAENPDFNTSVRIHVVQHSNWNEEQTSDTALSYTKEHTQYIKIRDANAYLNEKGGNAAFERAALNHSVFGSVWRAAFAYYDPQDRLDFSDTGELMLILGLGEIDIDGFRERFLENDNKITADPRVTPTSSDAQSSSQ